MKKTLYTIAILLLTLTVGMSQTEEEFSGKTFGEGITSSSYIDYGTLMEDLSKNDTVQTTLVATVSEVCQAKGCWMILESDGESSHSLMVRFKDYGFFVPKNISGRKVIIQGQAYATVVPVDELRHYAQDAGNTAEEIAKITEPERQYAFIASGVMMLHE